jgi:hypothetical protein
MRVKVAFVSLCIFSLSGCDPDVEIENAARGQFAQLPGRIGVIVAHPGREYPWIIERGELIRVKSLPRPPSTAAIMLYTPGDSPSGMPPQSGFVYWGPYLASPNGRYMAASIASKRDAPHSPAFVIVNLPTKETVRLIGVNTPETKHPGRRFGRKCDSAILRYELNNQGGS